MSTYHEWKRSGNRYRVHDDSSKTSFTHKDGSSANHHDFLNGGQAFSPEQYKAYMATVDDGAVLAESVEKHITGWYNHRDKVQNTKFISVTAKLDWAIWEIVRRLRAGKAEVRLAAIDVKCPTHPIFKVSSLDVLDQLAPSENVTRARNFAKSSSELLAVGRIFAHDIPWHIVWTTKVPGFALPDEFLKQRPWKASGDWTKNVLWNAEDTFQDAKRKITTRRWELVQVQREVDIYMSMRKMRIGSEDPPLLGQA